jgi:hypothetical protein
MSAMVSSVCIEGTGEVLHRSSELEFHEVSCGKCKMEELWTTEYEENVILWHATNGYLGILESLYSDNAIEHARR